MAKEFKLLQSTDGNNYGDFNDLVIEDYDIKLIDDEAKLQQQICKFILTQKGTMPMFIGYGTSIPSLINGRMNNVVIQDIVNEIKYGLKWVKEQNIIDDATLNIDIIQSINLQIIGERELQINIGLILTNGKYLQIQEKAIGRG